MQRRSGSISKLDARPSTNATPLAETLPRSAQADLEALMIMQEVDTIRFLESDSGDDAVAVVRASAGLVALALSLRADGDTEVVMQPADCEELLRALQQAVSIAKG